MGLVVLHRAGLKREKRPIPASADVLAGVELGTALADNDAAGEHALAAEDLDAEPLGVAVATVGRCTLTFLVRHESVSLSFDGLDFDDGKLLAMAAFSLHAFALLLLENDH